MLHAALAGFILAWIYKFLDKKYLVDEEFHAEIDWWMAFAVVITSSVAIFLFAVVIASFELPHFLTLVGYFFYLLVPFLIIKLMLDYSAKKALIYSIWVPFVALVCELPFLLLSGSNT